MTTDLNPAAGDELLPVANMIFDRRITLDATPERIWPWLLQLGKHRAGWYLPARLERLLPARRRASRLIDARFQDLKLGDRIPDYGGRDEWLEVARLEPPVALVYRTERRGRPFTWALLLTAAEPGRSELRLRFRGHLRSQGWQRRAIVTAGGFFDWLTGALMVEGLAERLE
jgi:hypothetical protein